MSLPDVYDLWVARDREQNEWLERRPVCFHCKNHIQSEMAVHLDIGWLCDDCIKDNTEDVTDE